MDRTRSPPMGIISEETIARAPRRLEGVEKVTGRVRYAGDLDRATMGEDMDVAVAIISTQATGRILSFEAADALASPGVRTLVTHENAPRLHRVWAPTGAEIGNLLPLQDDVIHYGGQCIGLLVADTLENARAAATLVQVRYSAPRADTAFTLEQGLGRAKDVCWVTGYEPGQVKVGRPDKAFDAAEHKVDLTFETPPHHHNAMEPGAVIAAFDREGRLTVHLPTQFSYGDAVLLGQAFGFGWRDRVPRLIAQIAGGFEFDNKVRVISTLAGGSFGSKNGNIHLLLAPMAAKLTGRPVKLVLTRQQVFSLMPYRGESKQRLRLAAGADGRLKALIQDAVVGQGAKGQFVEAPGEVVPKSYACANMRVHTQATRLDAPTPGWMRGPGSCLGSFALESAMDELAHKIGIDPLEFRIRNHADVEPDTGREWSSKSLLACYEAAARRIGWFERDPSIGAMREGRHLVGYGMASSIYPARQLPARARIILRADGRAVVQTAMHEIGQGAITAMSQIAADALGLPLEQVIFDFGDTALPYGGLTVGAMSTLSNGAAIDQAAQRVRKALLRWAVRDRKSPFYRMRWRDLGVVEGRVVAPGGESEAIRDLLARHPESEIEEEAITGRTVWWKRHGRQSFGAQFAKVLIDPDTMYIRVERLVGAFAGGRAINPLLVHSQCMGAMVWGLGQALMEESVVDERTGLWMNRNLAEALVPTNADTGGIEAIIINEDDTSGHPLGVKGMGEIGVVGTAAAIGNAVFHATGMRLTSLPFRIDRLLAAGRPRAAT